MGYLIHLQKFEGPVGLLLYLIRKEEMDIFDINIHEITRQYLDYIRLMKELDLEVAGEFVAMAATLIHIKSRMLLPQYNDEGEVVEQEDPRKELVQKLLEYQRYQDVAKKLYDRPLLNRDVWPTRLSFDWKDDTPGEVITEDDGLFSLIASYRKAIRRMNKAVHNVRAKVQSISSRVMEMKDRLIVGTRTTLRELLTAEGPELRAQMLITFLSLLELGRMGFVSVFQNEVYGEIYVEPKKAIERNVLERVQEFEGEDAEAVAKSIIEDAVEDRLESAQNEEALEELGTLRTFEEVAGHQAATDEEILAAEAALGEVAGVETSLQNQGPAGASAFDLSDDLTSSEQAQRNREQGDLAALSDDELLAMLEAEELASGVGEDTAGRGETGQG